MAARVLGLVAVLVAALLASAALDSAEARRGSGGHGHARSFSAPRAHSFAAPRTHRGIHYVPVHPRRFNRNYFHAGPRYVTDRCAWLRHRALATGSRMWWQRYHACRNGIYF